MISEYDQIRNILLSNGVTDMDEIEYGSQCYDELMTISQTRCHTEL